MLPLAKKKLDKTLIKANMLARGIRHMRTSEETILALLLSTPQWTMETSKFTTELTFGHSTMASQDQLPAALTESAGCRSSGGVDQIHQRFQTTT